jgi:uncharacterized NAD(P)/FAD-binding protein YdhS
MRYIRTLLFASVPSYLMKKRTIAIVGGGANGVASLVHLVLKLITQPEELSAEIVLLEKKGNFGPGLAYGTDQKGHILNTNAGLMGIFADEPLHFVEWLQANQQTIQELYPDAEFHADAYLPRNLYGDYLKSVLHTYVALGREKKVGVRLLADEAIDAEIKGQQVVLLLQSGTTIDADLVVLATGTPKPGNFRHLEVSSRYFDFPWPSERLLKNIPKQVPVSILGTSLTAIDTLITLADNGHTGPLTLYSRHGLLPRVQTPYDVPFERKVLTLSNIRKIIRQQQAPLRVSDLYRLFQAEAERALGRKPDWKQFNRIGKPQLELLRHDYELALKGTSEFQNILYSTRHLSFEVWKLLSAAEKMKFTKWLGPHWDINRHCIPPQNARKLITLLESDQLSVQPHSGKVEWNPMEECFSFYLQNGEKHSASYVINATGTAKDVHRMHIPLLQHLLKKQLIVPYSPGGIRANPYTLQVFVPGHSDAPLYGTGQLLGGELLDTNSVWFNVACIDRMTNDILRRLAYERPQ